MGIGNFRFGGFSYNQGLPWDNLRQTSRMQDAFIRRAAAARRRGFNETLNALNEMYGPYEGFGADRIQELAALYADPSSIRERPGYQFGLDEQMRALENSAAARGGALSGNALRAITEYGKNYSDTFYGNELDRLMAGAQMGYNMDWNRQNMLADLYTGRGASDAQMYGDFSNYVNKHENAGMDIISQWSSPSTWIGFAGAKGAGGSKKKKDSGNNNMSNISDWYSPSQSTSIPQYDNNSQRWRYNQSQYDDATGYNRNRNQSLQNYRSRWNF